MFDQVLTLLLQLPLGLLLAAVLVECFVVFKDRREVEPAVLWLLFWSCIISLLAALGHYLMKGTVEYALCLGLAGGLAAAGFLFKRVCRNKGISTFKDRFYPPNSYAPVKMPNQDMLLMGYRGALAGAVVLAAAGLFFGKVLQGNGTQVNQAVAKKAVETPTPAPPAPTTPTPETPAAPEAVANVTPANPADAPQPKEPSDQAAAAPAPATPESPAPMPTDPNALAAPAETPPMTPGTPAEPAAAPTTATPEATATPVTTPAPAVKAMESRPISRNSVFATKIRPIIQRYCVTCHGEEKQKGDLRLDTPDFIRAGVKGKPVINPGKPDTSIFYTLMIKPKDDPDRMPPKGDGVSRNDAELIKKWIAAGADMGDGVTTPSGGNVKFDVDALGGKLAAPDAGLLAALKEAGILYRAVSADGKVLEIDFSHADLPAGAIGLDRLAPIAQNIHTLDLSRTRIADADLSHLAGMANLTRLTLSRTQISDAGLAHIAGLTNLEFLNLYQTKVTDAGLASLSGLTKLKKLYAWQSQVTPGGAQALAAKISGLEVNMGN